MNNVRYIPLLFFCIIPLSLSSLTPPTSCLFPFQSVALSFLTVFPSLIPFLLPVPYSVFPTSPSLFIPHSLPSPPTHRQVLLWGSNQRMSLSQKETTTLPLSTYSSSAQLTSPVVSSLSSLFLLSTALQQVSTYIQNNSLKQEQL